MTRICTVQQCERKYMARGYCRLHYDRFRKGLPLEPSSKLAHRPAVVEYGVAKIPLGTDAKDGYAVVDIDNARIDKYKWFLHKGYAVRNSEYVPGKTRHTIRMHREILKTPDDLETDHINGNKLDNRRVNLRACTKAENQRNRKKQDSSSSYKGVTFQDGKWKAQLQCDGKFIYLGFHDTEESAAQAYSEAAKRYFGEFARV